jgi:hypothetical protein
MKPLFTRLVALAASIVVTFMIIDSMAFLGHPPPPDHAVMALMSAAK